METSTGAFFAGMSITFIILGVGFGGGLMMAKSALQEPTSRVRASVDTERPRLRVILPASNESAQPPQQPGGATFGPSGPAQEVQPVREINQPLEKQIKKVDSKKAEAEERERKRRYAERKAGRQAEARDRQQPNQQQPHEHTSAPVMAFGGDDPSRFGGSFFGN